VATSPSSKQQSGLSKYGDLKGRLIFLALALVVYRIGAHVPVPGIDPDMLNQLFNQQQGGILGLFNMFSGGALSRFSVFALGIMPYISASIIFQMLSYVLPSLEAIRKEGEQGRRKITQYTRYGTLALGLFQGFGIAVALETQPGLVIDPGFLFRITTTVSLLTGTMFLMWLGEQITEFGVGNGISIILFAGIVARLPVTFGTVWQYMQLGMESAATSGQYLVLAPLFIVLFLIVIWVIVFMNESERRIPVQYAKKVVGRKMYGGQSTFLPVKVAMSGVMPVIFASSILFIPQFIQFFWNPSGGFGKAVLDAFSQTGWLYIVLYFLLIVMFAYFYMSIQYNPLEMANNLRQNNGTIPGIRPGKPTADFIAKILSKVTLIGALFLAFVALIPIIYTNVTGMYGLSLGGTSIIIIVGVALETVKQLESQMMLRHYKGFLD